MWFAYGFQLFPSACVVCEMTRKNADKNIYICWESHEVGETKYTCDRCAFVCVCTCKSEIRANDHKKSS